MYMPLNALQSAQNHSTKQDYLLRTGTSFKFQQQIEHVDRPYFNTDQFVKNYEQHLYERELARKIISNKMQNVIWEFLPYYDSFSSQQIFQKKQKKNNQEIQKKCSELYQKNHSNKNFQHSHEEFDRLRLENSSLRSQIKGLRKLVLQYEIQMQQITKQKNKNLLYAHNNHTQKIFNEESIKSLNKKIQKDQNQETILKTDLSEKTQELQRRNRTIDYLIKDNSNLKLLLREQSKTQQKYISQFQQKQAKSSELTKSNQLLVQQSERLHVSHSCLTPIAISRLDSKSDKMYKQKYKQKQAKLVRKHELIKKYLQNQLKKLKKQHYNLSMFVKKQLLVFFKLTKMQIQQLIQSKH